MTTALPDRLPHFVRVVRALAIVAGVTSTGCASSVRPDWLDAASTDAVRPDVSATDAIVADRDPCLSPGPLNSPCTMPGLQCGMPSCERWVCQPGQNGNGPQWGQELCGGPLDPPDLQHLQRA